MKQVTFLQILGSKLLALQKVFITKRRIQCLTKLLLN